MKWAKGFSLRSSKDERISVIESVAHFMGSNGLVDLVQGFRR
jgi:hypothetical protein